MTGFHDVSFPMRLAFGAVGGPERRTEIVTLASGKEVRNARWAGSRRRWDVGGALSELGHLQELVSFFEARMGPLYGFRFRDPLDHSSVGPDELVSATDQILGVGDDTQTVFQLGKAYGDVRREITKPITGTVRVALDGIERTSGWSVATDSGEVAFETAPPTGVTVSAGFEFDCPVRFENDHIQSVVESFGAGRIVSVSLIELR